MANIWEKAMSILAENLNFGSSYLITTVLHIRTIYTTHIRVVRVWEGTGRHVLFHFSTVADAWSIIARLHLMPKSDIASQTMIDFQFSKKKKIRLGRIKRAGGVAQGAGHSVSQSTNGRVAWQQQLHDARRYVAAAELLPMDFSGPCDEMMCWRWLLLKPTT